MKACLALVALSCSLTAGQLPPGTIDVPVPRQGDCGGKGLPTYVNRLSARTPNDVFPDVCRGLGNATVHFNNPCDWADGQAQLTTAHFTNMCKGATRVIHWHNQADEWGYMNKGKLQTFLASPEGFPWPSSNNVIGERGVWYFPSGWLHGLMCLTPEEEGGCEFTIVFASPQAAEPNGHNLATTMAQSPDEVAAQALGVNLTSYVNGRPTFARSQHSVHYSNSNMTAPIVTAVEKGACDPTCPPITETVAFPAAVDGPSVEQTVNPPVAEGVTLHRIRTTQFPFARTMSQERAELGAGAIRPMVWASADGVIVVLKGHIRYGLEGGMLGKEAHLAFVNETLGPGDVAYIPNARAYWFEEATGSAEAETITVFNVGDWKSFEMKQSMSQMPEIVALSNLYLTKDQLQLNPALRVAAMPQATGLGWPMVAVGASASVVAASAVLLLGGLVRRRRSGMPQTGHGPLLA